MRTARPDIKLLGVITGDHKIEAQLHERFQEFHIAGEWFRFANEIRSFAKEELSTFKSPPKSVTVYDRRRRPLVRRRAIERRYGISPRCLDNWMKERKVPVIKNRKDVVF